MSHHLVARRPLPCQADRQKIIHHAELVLTEARAIAVRCDYTFTRLSAEWPAEYANAAARSSF
jgi:hypothetical protein